MTRSKSSIPKERTDFHVNDCLKIVRIHKIPLPLPFFETGHCEKREGEKGRYFWKIIITNEYV